DSMEGLPPEEVKKPKTEKEVLQHLANYSNELCELVANAREGELLSGFNDLAKRYQNSISVSAGDAVSLISSVTSKVENYSEFVRINPQKSSLMRNMMQLHRPDQSAKSESASPKSPGPKSGTTVEPSSTQPTKAQTEEQTQTLRNGIQEIADVMKGNYALGDIIYMIMETMYRGFLFDRVVFAMRDKTHTQMTARFGLGNEIENIIPKFHFSIGSSNDIFNIAIAKAKGIVIDDAESPNIIKSLPQWYRSSITTSSFLIYPITVKNLCIGVIYADRQKRGVLLTESQMQQMEELRQMAVNAIEQKRPGES
ncbi:MAG: GAF domain-containing protein, partial [Syntrophaceae bacterium]|nr:GAF domain-containing protein [Syntrophaceae bacterium]